MLVDVRAARSRASSTCRSCRHEQLPHARRGEPHLDRADRAQPRHHRRSQRHRARAQLLRLHARDHSRARSTTWSARSTSSPRVVEITPRDRRRFKKLLEESKGFESLPIRTRLTDEEIARFAANRYRFPGVEINARLFRQYPQGELFSHVVGHIGRINQRELDQLEAEDRLANYRGTDYIGKTGLEQSYEQPPARHDRRRGGRGRFRRARGAHALAHAAGLGQQPGAQARRAPAGDRLPRVRRAPRRAGRDRARDRRRARVREQAGLRSQPLRRRHRPAELERAQQFARPADGQPRARRHLPAGLHLQAVHGARRAHLRQAHAAADDQRSRAISTSAGTSSATTRSAATASVDMYKSIVVSCDTYYYVLANDLGIDAHLALHGHARLRQPHRHRHRRASRPACCRRRNGSASASSAPSSRSGTRARRSASASARATTPTRRCSSPRAIATIANDGVMFRPHIVNYVEDIRTRERTAVEPKPLRTLAAEARASSRSSRTPWSA